jgi:hypothetical protein
LVVFSEQVIIRLILGRARFLWNGLVPSVGVRKHRIDIKYNAPEGVFTMPDHLAQMIFRARLKH